MNIIDKINLKLINLDIKSFVMLFSLMIVVIIGLIATIIIHIHMSYGNSYIFISIFVFLFSIVIGYYFNYLLKCRANK